MKVLNPYLKKQALNVFVAVLGVMSLAGCATVAGNHPLPQEGPTMKQIWDFKTRDSGMNALADKRAQVGGPLLKIETSEPATRLRQQFPLLPNPDIELYVRAHLAGKHQLPVQSYVTVFKLYDRDHYALPGEVLPESVLVDAQERMHDNAQ